MLKLKPKIILFLCLLLIIPIYSLSPYTAKAAATKNSVISIPNSNLSGSANKSKTVYLDLPSGVSSSSVNTASIKYNGSNSVVGTIIVENGKIKITLKGNESTKTINNVQGFSGNYKDFYSSNPGNSIWLYSDGKRWQINDYKYTTDTMQSYDRNATDGYYPSQKPPLTTLTTKSNLSKTNLTWYNNSSSSKIDNVDIIQSSIKPIEWVTEQDPRTPNVKSVNFKDGRLIVDHVIPNTSDKTFNAPWRPEPPDGKHDLTPPAEGRLYYIIVNYYYIADAKVTEYSYAGNVSFDYTLPTEPTLTGTVTLNKPNPNPTKLGDKDEPVQISLMGQLQGYNDASNIDEWVFYAKEKDRNNTLKTKKESAKTFNVNTLFDFEIKKSSVTGEHFTQEYALTVLVRFKKPIVTKNGTITSLEQPLQISAGVYKNNPQVTFPPNPTIPTEPEGKPPIARISTARYIKAGSDMLVSGNASYDPDGYITDYAWSTSGAQGEIGNVPRGMYGIP